MSVKIDKGSSSQGKSGDKASSSTKGTIIAGVDGNDLTRIVSTNLSGDLNSNSPDIYSLLGDILKEQKKTNFYLSLMNDMNITNQDIEV